MSNSNCPPSCGRYDGPIGKNRGDRLRDRGGASPRTVAGLRRCGCGCGRGRSIERVQRSDGKSYCCYNRRQSSNEFHKRLKLITDMKRPQ